MQPTVRRRAFRDETPPQDPWRNRPRPEPEDDFPEYVPPTRGRLPAVIIGIVTIHVLLFLALTQRVSTSGMGESGPVYPEQYLPACEMTDILGPLGQAGVAGATPPERLLRPGEPALPPVIAAQKLSGSATLGLIVDAAGKVTTACVGKSSGDVRLDSALWANAPGWRFKPGMVNGKAVGWRFDVPVSVPKPAS